MPLLPCAYAHGYKDVGAMRLFAQTHVFAGDPSSTEAANWCMKDLLRETRTIEYPSPLAVNE